MARALRQNGYTVLEAANGTEALRLVDEHAWEEIHVLVTDLVMPLMGGAELVRRLSPRYPNTKVIYTSGYVEEGAMPPEISETSFEFLHKPYPPTDLIAKIREILDEQTEPLETSTVANGREGAALDASERLSEESR